MKYLGFGSSVLSRLIKTSVKKNIYYEIKDKVIEEKSNGTTVIRNTQKIKVYGLDSTKGVRARLIELLYDRVNYHKDKFIAPIILQEMQAMEVKKNGKVEHSNTSHDDQVFSYLMALYVWYDGVNLAERFNIQKNTIKTDEDLEEAIVSLEELDAGTCERIDISNEINDEYDPILKDQLEFIEDANRKAKLVKSVYDIQDADDARALQQVLSTKVGRDAYIKKNHIDPNVPTMGGVNDYGSMNCIPDEVFLNFNGESNEKYTIFQGNLGDIFSQL